MPPPRPGLRPILLFHCLSLAAIDSVLSLEFSDNMLLSRTSAATAIALAMDLNIFSCGVGESAAAFVDESLMDFALLCFGGEMMISGAEPPFLAEAAFLACLRRRLARSFSRGL